MEENITVTRQGILGTIGDTKPVMESTITDTQNRENIMNIFGMWFPVVPSLWVAFASAVVTYFAMRGSIYRQAKADMEAEVKRQQSAQMFSQYLNTMMRGKQ